MADWTWTKHEARCGTTYVDAQVDQDGDVVIEHDRNNIYIPAEVLAEVLRRSGYVVTKP